MSKTWREMEPDEQAELLLSGTHMCEVCGGHGTIQQIPAGYTVRCSACTGNGYTDANKYQEYFKWWRVVRRTSPYGPPKPIREQAVQRVQRTWLADADVSSR